MAEDRDAEVDPRFDPVFQRGYDPKVHGGRRPRPAPRHATAPTPIAPAARPMAVVPAPVDAPRAAGRRRAPRTASQPRRACRRRPTVEPVAARRNPFRLALLIASIVAIGAACADLDAGSARTSTTAASRAPTQARCSCSQLIDALLVPLLTGGLIGLILWLAIGAHRRIAATRPDAGDDRPPLARLVSSDCVLVIAVLATAVDPALDVERQQIRGRTSSTRSTGTEQVTGRGVPSTGTRSRPTPTCSTASRRRSSSAG